MEYLLPIALVVHIAAAVFWAGTTMVQARIGNDHARELFPPQMGSAALAIIAGAILWQGYHSTGFGSVELALGIGIAAALVALVIQILAFRTLATGRSNGLASPGPRRLAAALMGIAILGMALSRAL